MKAICINGEKQTMEMIEVGNLDDVRQIIGCNSLEKDETGPGADHLFFDEECFLKAKPGKIKVDSLVPVSGIALVLGCQPDGQLCDVEVSIEALKSRTRFP